jgi:tRNA nucleotidyltransferase/poly(A) polymerase
MKVYMVGGCVRDEIMGFRSKDIDYTVVMEPEDIPDASTQVNGYDPYNAMVHALAKQGNRIIRDGHDVPVGADFFTVRAIHPDRGAVDYVLARKESGYSDGRRPDTVEIGTLHDDLSRRDFTMNAIAKDERGEFIDPFDGQADIRQRTIRAVGDPFARLTEDALRAVRALRFAVTKNMTIEPGLVFAMRSKAVTDALENNVAQERIRDEVDRMCAFNTVDSIMFFYKFPELTSVMFRDKVSLSATMKER